jgi:hypothetical protein
VSNQDPSPSTRAEIQRIYGEFLAHKLGASDVHVYIVRPDGSALAGLDIGASQDPQQLRHFLTETSRTLATTPGAPLIKPHPQSTPPKSSADDLVLHLVARSQAAGAWHEFPSENWFVLSRQEWIQLLPHESPRVGLSWDVEPGLTRKLLTRFYPQTEETSSRDRNRIDFAQLRLTVTTIGDGVSRARIDGAVRMKHSFYPGRDNEDYVDAKLIGFLDFTPAGPRIQRLRIITGQATYMGSPFDVALRSVSQETLEALGQ